MSNERQLPRLGDREGLRIDVTRGAVEMYRLGVDKTLTLEQAERDLVADLREAYVTSSIDRLMTVRYRNRSRNIDVQASLTRLSPDHVRADDVSVRSRGAPAKFTSGRGGREDGGRDPVYRIAGKGAVRLDRDGTVSWRDHGVSTWRSASMQMLARDFPTEHGVWVWLRRHGIARPSPSGPSGTTTPEDERGTKQCLLRLTEDEIERLDTLAKRAGINRSELVRRWIARER